MQAIFSVTVPFFALVLAGYLAARRGLLPLEAVPGLNVFVLYFALPCMLFRFGQSLPLSELLNPAVLSVYLLSALVLVGFAIAISLRPPVGLRDAAFGALVAAFPNSGFMGVPLLVALIGPSAAGPTMTTLLVDVFVTSSLCLAIAQSRHERDTQPPSLHDVTSTLPPGVDAVEPPAERSASGMTRGWQTLWRVLRAPLMNPLPWSIGLGALASVTGLVLPGPANTVIAMLGNAASPVALFTIGAVLWRSGLPPATAGVRVLDDRALTRRTTPLALTLPVVLIKNLLHPLLVLLLGLAARALGAPLSGFQLMVMVLVAALPSASNVSLLAERHGADNGRVARIIMASTVLAFGTFSGVAWLFGVQPR
jgi:malonate transporter and related proteins